MAILLSAEQKQRIQELRRQNLTYREIADATGHALSTVARHATGIPYLNKRLLRAECVNGHPWAENTVWRPDGGRWCLLCRRNDFRRYREKRGLIPAPTRDVPRFVNWDPVKGKWRVRIRVDGQQRIFGRFSSLEDATSRAAEVLGQLQKCGRSFRYAEAAE